MEHDGKLERIVDARMKLRNRFLEKTGMSPSLADKKPQGSGADNRHGMPKLPVGQYLTQKWPVFDLGYHPNVTPAQWRLSLNGACENKLMLRWEDFMDMEQTDDVSDFHCVTTWSKMDMQWRGVRFLDLAALAQPHESATHIMCYAYDGYCTNIGLEEALKPDVLLVHTYEGKPLPKEHGGPVRMITPQLYAWKGAKWIKRIEFLNTDLPGFWEERGYSNTAYPWRNDRYG